MNHPVTLPGSNENFQLSYNPHHLRKLCNGCRSKRLAYSKVTEFDTLKNSTHDISVISGLVTTYQVRG